MVERLLSTAPALAVGLLLGGCGVFAGTPAPLPFASGTPEMSLKDAWEPAVVKAAVAPAPTTKPRRSSLAVRATADCKTDSACSTILSALINDPRRQWIGQPQTAAEYATARAFSPTACCAEP
jgi:hypothetical protein